MKLTQCQNFKKKYFLDTNWFSNNKDSIFTKKDTIRLIKYNYYDTLSKTMAYVESERKYFKHRIFIRIKFNRSNKMSFIRMYGDGGIVDYGEWKWHLNKKGNLLFKFNGKIIYIFRPILEREIIVDSEYYNKLNGTITTELILLRIKK